VRYYENLFIVHPNYEQEKLNSIIESLKKEINEQQGNILTVEDWGKRRLAYPIEKQKYGTYVLVQYESENSKINREIESWMKLNQDILANITIALDKKPEPRSKTQADNGKYEE
jgi:small subunit ribosomal protein S6